MLQHCPTTETDPDYDSDFPFYQFNWSLQVSIVGNDTHVNLYTIV